MKLIVILLLSMPFSVLCQKTIVVDDNETEPITYTGSHRKIGDSIVLNLGVNELNRAYGYLEIDGKRDSLVKPWAGGEVITEDLKYYGKFVKLELNNCHLTIERFRTKKIKVAYFDILKYGLKPIKFKMEKVDF